MLPYWTEIFHMDWRSDIYQFNPWNVNDDVAKKLAKYMIIRDIHCKLLVSSLQLLEYFCQIIHTVIRYNKPIDVIFGTIYIISISNLIAVWYVPVMLSAMF